MTGHARRTRMAAGATSLVAIVVIALVAVLATRTTEPSITVEGGASTTLPPTTTPTTYGPSTAAGGFIPPTTLQNGLVVLPVTLPDGETFTMQYPPAMRIAQLGFLGGINVARQAGSDQVHDDSARLHGQRPAGTRLSAARTVRRCTCSTRSNASATSGPTSTSSRTSSENGWPSSRRRRGSTAATSANWAASLDRRTDDSNGYLVLHVGHRCRSATRSTAGSAACPGTTSSSRRISIAGSPSRTRACTGASRTATARRACRGATATSTCRPVEPTASSTSPIRACTSARSHHRPAPLPCDRRRQRPPRRRCRSRRRHPQCRRAGSHRITAGCSSRADPSRRPPTAAPRGTSSASLGNGNWAARADPLHRRVRRVRVRDRHVGPLMITHDAGATWTNVDTPFADDRTTCRSRTAWCTWSRCRRSPPASFGIWSTPVEHLVWKRDPLSLADRRRVPTPTEQIVLAGDQRLDRQRGPHGDLRRRACRPERTGSRGIRPASARTVPRTCPRRPRPTSSPRATKACGAHRSRPPRCTSRTTAAPRSPDRSPRASDPWPPRARPPRSSAATARSGARPTAAASWTRRRQVQQPGRDPERHRLHDDDAGLRDLSEQRAPHDARRRRDLDESDAPVSPTCMKSFGVVAVIVLGAFALGELLELEQGSHDDNDGEVVGVDVNDESTSRRDDRVDTRPHHSTTPATPASRHPRRRRASSPPIKVSCWNRTVDIDTTTDGGTTWKVVGLDSDRHSRGLHESASSARPTVSRSNRAHVTAEDHPRRRRDVDQPGRHRSRASTTSRSCGE